MREEPRVTPRLETNPAWPRGSAARAGPGCHPTVPPSTPPPSAGIHSCLLQGPAMQSWWLLQNRKATIQTRPFSCQKCGVFAVCPQPANQTLALCPRPRPLPGTLWVKHPTPPLWPRGLLWHLPLQGWPPQAPPGAALSRRPRVVLVCRVDGRRLLQVGTQCRPQAGSPAPALTALMRPLGLRLPVWGRGARSH